MSDKLAAPVELTDAELAVVSGGVVTVAAGARVGISQSIRQSASLTQVGGDLSIGGGSYSSTSVSGSLDFLEAFSASIDQTASNSNTGSVTATVSVSS